MDKNSEAWYDLLDANPDILSEIRREGKAIVSARAIKEYREPRLMAKIDNSSQRPEPFQKYDLNILPASTRAYYVGMFDLYEKLPAVDDLPMQPVPLPRFDTLNPDNITNEAAAINALSVSGVLDTFLDTEDLTATFNGRSRSGQFNFRVNCISKTQQDRTQQELSVDSAQIEVDAGFENVHNVVILEAKNVLHSDFHIRQLYFPFRKYSALTEKDIRLVFSQYSNGIFNLFEYEFTDPRNYSSISLKKHARFSIAPVKITHVNIDNILRNSKIETPPNVPFPQADSLDRLISYLELFGNNGGEYDYQEFTEEAGVVGRQIDYYLNAGRFLGLFSTRNASSLGLTPLGFQIFQSPPHQRYIELIKIIFSREVFNWTYTRYRQKSTFPSVDEIANHLLSSRVIQSPSTAHRRAQTVLAWSKWIAQRAEI